ncbi:hypothetical protein [Pseudomonas chlororaphis]|uniref:hypothetical protein n=1 Tax=Pseudomonas chlororaphis TaxID=587753 RepID=UPI000F58F21B|nr:hypothetical protein [Pseudomonas chlororaphis]
MRSILDDEGVAEGGSLFAPDPNGARRIARQRERVVFVEKSFGKRPSNYLLASFSRNVDGRLPKVRAVVGGH